MTAYEAADVIGVSHSQVTRYVAAGSLPAKRIGPTILIAEEDAKKFVKPSKGNPNFRKK